MSSERMDGWMTEELMGKRVREFWDRISGALLKKRGILFLDASKGHLPENVV
jgi:hypothetical protein